MSRLCLDTSAYSHFKRGHAGAVAAITSASTVLVPAVVLGELHAGFRAGNSASRNEAELNQFLRQRVVSVIPVDEEIASLYAELVVDLRKAGTPLPSNDIWIGACAVREGASVITFDAHFASMRRVAARVLDV